MAGKNGMKGVFESPPAVRSIKRVSAVDCCGLLMTVANCEVLLRIDIHSRFGGVKIVAAWYVVRAIDFRRSAKAIHNDRYVELFPFDRHEKLSPVFHDRTTERTSKLFATVVCRIFQACIFFRFAQSVQ